MLLSVRVFFEKKNRSIPFQTNRKEKKVVVGEFLKEKKLRELGGVFAIKNHPPNERFVQKTVKKCEMTSFASNAFAV